MEWRERSFVCGGALLLIAFLCLGLAAQQAPQHRPAQETGTGEAPRAKLGWLSGLPWSTSRRAQLPLLAAAPGRGGPAWCRWPAGPGRGRRVAQAEPVGDLTVTVGASRASRGGVGAHPWHGEGRTGTCDLLGSPCCCYPPSLPIVSVSVLLRGRLFPSAPFPPPSSPALSPSAVPQHCSPCCFPCCQVRRVHGGLPPGQRTQLLGPALQQHLGAGPEYCCATSSRGGWTRQEQAPGHAALQRGPRVPPCP